MDAMLNTIHLHLLAIHMPPQFATLHLRGSELTEECETAQRYLLCIKVSDDTQYSSGK